MKKRKKLMLFAILIFLLSASASGAYAYWAGTVNAPDQKTDTININIGEAKPVNTMLTVSELPTLPKLVPAGQKNNSLDSDNCVEMRIIKSYCRGNKMLAFCYILLYIVYHYKERKET